jgi:hypothetical protein
MHLINISQMQEVIEHVAIGENEPCWFHGEPGCGKTAGIGAACEKLDVELIDLRLGQYDTVDFRGFPGVAEDGTTVWHMASTLPFVGNKRFDPDKRKMIFFDEADHGTQAVQGICYQLMQERRVGEHVLQPNTFICSAGNRKQDKGVGGKSFKPLNNRNTHYEVGPDAKVWVSCWALQQQRIPGELIAFLSFREALISNFDPSSPEPAFATPRTWEKVGKYFTNPNLSESVRNASIEGAVGGAASCEFIGFCKVIADMPSMKAIEADPLGIAISDKPEVRWAIAVGIAGEMAQRPESTAAFQKYLDRMDPEFAILAWQLGLRKNETGLLGRPEFMAVAKTHQATFAYVNR